jgi:type VI secretion system protein ImpJ
VKKAAQQTARVYWKLGQALLPEHFYAQEQAIREEVALRARMSAAPSWGVGTLQWDTFQLLKGIVHIQEMTLFLQSGTLVDIPGNTAPAICNLNTTGAARTPLYAHLHGAPDVVAVQHGPDEEGIERMVQHIELSTAPYSESGVQSFKLAELESGADGTWSLSAAYLPPMVQVGASPFFEPHLQRMSGLVRTLRQTLADEIKESQLESEAQSGAKHCMRGLLGFQGLLVDLEAGVHHHPYQLFAALRSLYVDVCLLRDTPPTEAERAYDHEELAETFGALLERLEENVGVRGRRTPVTELVRRDGLIVATIGKEMQRAKDVFLLVQKPQVSSPIDLSRVKLAAESRLQTVYERALRGIPFQHVESPPFIHGMSATVDFYALASGQEWDYALREGKMVLYEAPQLRGCRLYLHARTE